MAARSTRLLAILCAACFPAVLFASTSSSSSQQAGPTDSSRVLASLLGLPAAERTVGRALGLCAAAAASGAPPGLNCAWLVLSGRATAANFNDTGGGGGGGTAGPVELVSCSDPAATAAAPCTYRRPADLFTAQSDCLACPACSFLRCVSDARGCRVVCACACGGEVAVVPCHGLCRDVSQCPASAGAADQLPGYCHRAATQPPTPAGPASAAVAVSLAVAGTVALLALLALLLWRLRLCRGQSSGGDRPGVVEWRRLSTGGDGGAGVGGGAEDNEDAIPLGGGSSRLVAA